jgi:hypothetical protein
MVVWFVDGGPFFYFFSFLEKYSLVVFVVGISTSIPILFISIFYS